MGETIRVRLPMPPSSNNIFAGKTRRYASSQYARWKREADLTVMAARVPRVAGPVRVAITLHPPDNRRADADNRIKPISDCLVRMGIIEDDSKKFVRGISAEWGSVADPPFAEVCITPA